MTDTSPIEVPPMCRKHQALLLHQLGIGPKGPWASHIISAQITLFQAATTFPDLYDRIDGDIARLSEVGCLACYRPDVFGEIVHAFQKGGFKENKDLGDRYVKAFDKPEGE